MSRTKHVRPRRTRTDPTISAKKPDESRRWHKRNMLSDLPILDMRKLDRRRDDE